MSEELQQELERYKETNRRLNRRCQKLESRVAKYRRRYVAVLNPAKNWERSAEWQYREAHAHKKELWRQLERRQLGKMYLKWTLREINTAVALFFQRLGRIFQYGRLAPKAIWERDDKIRALEKKVKEYENRDSGK